MNVLTIAQAELARRELEMPSETITEFPYVNLWLLPLREHLCVCHS
jgi:hypothetical protein